MFTKRLSTQAYLPKACHYYADHRVFMDKGTQVKWEPLYDHLISVFPLHAWKRIHLIVLKMIIVSYVTRSKLYLSIYLMYKYVSSVDH